MITPLAALLLVVASLALLARAVVCHLRCARRGVRLETPSMSAVLSSPDAYRPISRLFSREDAAFVSEVTGPESPLQSRLRRSRSRIMRLYLRQIRSDFTALWRLGCHIASQSPNPNFAALLARQFLAFHVLLVMARLRGFLGWKISVPVQASALVSTMEGLRTIVRGTVSELEPRTQAAGINRT